MIRTASIHSILVFGEEAGLKMSITQETVKTNMLAPHSTAHTSLFSTLCYHSNTYNTNPYDYYATLILNIRWRWQIQIRNIYLAVSQSRAEHPYKIVRGDIRSARYMALFFKHSICRSAFNLQIYQFL